MKKGLALNSANTSRGRQVFMTPRSPLVGTRPGVAGRQWRLDPIVELGGPTMLWANWSAAGARSTL